MACLKEVFIIVLMFCISVASNAQRIQEQLNKLSKQETGLRASIVYLQTNKSVFLAGEDLWFQAYVLDGIKFTLTDVDQTLYLILQHQDTDSTVWKEMYRIQNGVSSGYVYLPQELPAGNYFLKAYTSHSSVGDSVCTSVAPLSIVPTAKAIRNAFEPASGIGAAPIQFGVFPEGGNLVAAIENTIAWKAIDAQGEPVTVSGTVFQDNQPLLSFSTQHEGMGKFKLVPNAGSRYAIRLTGVDSMYSFPLVQQRGITLQVVKHHQDTLQLLVKSNYKLPGDIVFVRLQTRGVAQAVAAASLADSVRISLPITESLGGISELTLFDHQLRPLAERLVFLHPEQQLYVRVDSLRSEYSGKEKVSLMVHTTDQTGRPVPASLSMRVYDGLFDQSLSANNIQNYVLLTSQLRGRIYNPAHYFDTTNQKRIADLDLLLLTQGWRRYDQKNSVVADHIVGRAVPVRAKTAQLANSSMLIFDYNKSATHIALTDERGQFTLGPDDLSIAPRIFVKYFAEEKYRVEITDPFHLINQAEKTAHSSLVYAKNTTDNVKLRSDTGLIFQYASLLDEVEVTAKGRSFSDKYLGYLDSVAKYEANFDFVGACNWLNCPACGSGTKPVEGVVYSELKESKKRQVTSHPYSFKPEDVRREPYQYPKFTEAELLEKFNMQVTKGYYAHRSFYEPNYDKESTEQIDLRNTLLWKPHFTTDTDGKASVDFFTSDIRAGFKGVIEGISGSGLLGVQTIRFQVR